MKEWLFDFIFFCFVSWGLQDTPLCNLQVMSMCNMSWENNFCSRETTLTYKVHTPKNQWQTFTFKACNSLKVIHPKHILYMLASKIDVSVGMIDSFLSFSLIKFLVQTIQFTETLISQSAWKLVHLLPDLREICVSGTVMMFQLTWKIPH